MVMVILKARSSSRVGCDVAQTVEPLGPLSPPLLGSSITQREGSWRGETAAKGRRRGRKEGARDMED